MAVRISSDVERKRLFGLFHGISKPPLQGGMYTEEANKATYGRLLDLTRMITKDGHSVVIDATFLKAKERYKFYQAFDKKNLNFIVIDLEVDADELRSRVQKRTEDGGNVSDADASVLEKQLHSTEPITNSEKVKVLRIDANIFPDPKEVVSRVHTMINVIDKTY
jgi:predicted kinase